MLVSCLARFTRQHTHAVSCSVDDLTRLCFGSAFCLISISEHALCPQREEFVFQQDICDHVRRQKAGLEKFSLKG